MSNQAPFRYDVVGSFLRPEYLKDARAKFAEGRSAEEQLKETEDKAIKELVEKEKEVGLQAVTDGEFRRRYWHLDFLADLDGVEEIKSDHWSVHFKGHQPKAATLKIADKVDFGEHPFLEHFKYLKSVARRYSLQNDNSFTIYAASDLLCTCRRVYTDRTLSGHEGFIL